MITLTKDCVVCHKTHTAHVLESEVEAYQNGAFVQDAFCRLDVESRELFFLSGICGKCFDDLFPDFD